jgi:LysM repeat protein
VVHIVQSGETLALVANRYGSTVASIADANSLDDPNLVIRGQVLIVPLESAEAAITARPVLTSTAGTQPFAEQAPVLVAPDDESAAAGPVDLRWQWTGTLDADQFFLVAVRWFEQEAPSMYSYTEEPQYTLDLTGRSPGTYWWSVQVVAARPLGDNWVLVRRDSPFSDPFSIDWPSPEP